ncbi:MAG: hypothetical protein SGILL_008562 [Bacillariaceae sp.]
MDIGGPGGRQGNTMQMAMPPHAAHQVRQNMQREEFDRFNAPPPGQYNQQQQQQQYIPPMQQQSMAPMSMGHMIAMQQLQGGAADPRFLGGRVINRSTPPMMIHPGNGRPGSVTSSLGSPRHNMEVAAAQPSCMNTLFGGQVKSGKKKKTSMSDAIRACNQVDPPTADADFEIKLPSHYNNINVSRQFVPPTPPPQQQQPKMKMEPSASAAATATSTPSSTTTTSRFGNAMQAFQCNGVRGPGHKFDYKVNAASAGIAANEDSISDHDSFDDKTFIMDMDDVTPAPASKKKISHSRKKKAASSPAAFSKSKAPLGEIQEKNSDKDYESAEESFEPAQQHHHVASLESSEDSKDATYSEVASKPRRSKKQREVSAGPMIEVATPPETPPTPEVAPIPEVQQRRAAASPSPLMMFPTGRFVRHAAPSMLMNLQQQPSYSSAMNAFQQGGEMDPSDEAVADMEARGMESSRQRSSRQSRKNSKTKPTITMQPEFSAQEQAQLVQNIRDICIRATPELNGEQFPSFDENSLKPKHHPDGRTVSPELSEFSSGGENKQRLANNKDKKKKKKSSKTKAKANKDGEEKMDKQDKKERKAKKEKRKKKKAAAAERARALAVLEAPM